MTTVLMRRTSDTANSSATGFGGEQGAWKALQAGDRTAADALVAATYERIFATLVRLAGGDRDLAADLTQETYRKAWASLANFRGDCAFSSWLYRIAHTTFLSHVRRPRRLQPLEEPDSVLDSRPSAEHRAAQAEDAQRLHLAVAALSEDLQFAVTARYWNETPVREIALLQGITEVGVRKRLQRAHRELADLLNTDQTTHHQQPTTDN